MLAHLCAHPWSNASRSQVKIRKTTREIQNDNVMDSKKLSESSKEEKGSEFIFKLPDLKPEDQNIEKDAKKSKNEDICVCNRPDLINSVMQGGKKPENVGIYKDFETYLSKSSIQEPGNIPMVVIRDVVLRATGAFKRKDLVLAMGNVVNGIHKTSDWIFVRTAQGNDGYIPYNSCLPLGIRPPTRKGLSQLAPWEINNEITQTCNQTDTQKLCEFINPDEAEMQITKLNDVIMVVCDYISKNEKQISVRRGENVQVIREENDNWVKVRTIDGLEGLIPVAYTSKGKQYFF